MQIPPKILKIRKIQNLKAYYDDLIKEEEDRIADAKLDYRFTIECKPTLLMQKIYALCYRDSFRRGHKMIEYWKQRFIEEKNKLLTNE